MPVLPRSGKLTMIPGPYIPAFSETITVRKEDKKTESLYCAGDRSSARARDGVVLPAAR